MSRATVAMIGAGPASLYGTEVLASEGFDVVILNRDIKPGGLAEFGIYPTKYKMKRGLRTYFDKILSDPAVSYLGNVSVGLEGDLSLEEVRDLGVSAVVVAVGAQGTNWLGLPGETGPGVYHAKDLVYHYNGLPPYSEEEFPIGNRVVVVGLGNVCLDIVHWLVCEKQVESVTAVARRGPAERKFTRKEYKLVSGALDQEGLRRELGAVAPVMESVGQDPERELENLLKFVDVPLEKESPTKFSMRFLRSPVGVARDDDGRVTGLITEVTELMPPTEEGWVGLRRTGRQEVVACDTVVFAIGDSIEPSLGLPLSEERANQFATVREPWPEEDSERPRYMVYDPAAGAPMWGTFVVGWARQASDGLVGKARADAVQGCEEILAYLRGEFPEGPGAPREGAEVAREVRALLQERGVRFVEYDEVVRLKEMEEEEAQKRGLEEFRYSRRQAILECLSGTRVVDSGEE